MPLVLDLLRHGAALPAAAEGDAARRLSPRGVRDLERLAAHLAGLGWCPDRAFTSPLVRARETARIALEPTAPGLSTEVLEALAPDRAPADVLQALALAGAERGHLLLVGHQPLLGELARHLTAGAAPALAPGDLARVTFAGGPAVGGGTLDWVLRAQDLG